MLDNVRVTIGNRYTANVVSYSDYYAFGMQLPGRHGVQAGADGYRYGFNDMEKDDELKGEANSYDFGARMYDPRVGRFLSTDPDFRKYPDLSTYCYAANSPVLFVDEDGEGPIIGWKITSMAIDKENKVYTISISITVEEDFILVNESSMKLIPSQGLAIANSIAARKAAYFMSTTFRSDDKDYGFVAKEMKKQYTHIPEDYVLAVNVSVDFKTGTVSYTDNPSTITNKNAVLMGIRDDLPPSGDVLEPAGLADQRGGEAFAVKKEYISPNPIVAGVTKGELNFNASNTSMHEWLHLDGASDLYDDPGENNNSVMGSVSLNFNADKKTVNEITAHYLIIARKAHQILIGDPKMGNWNQMIIPVTQPSEYEKAPLNGGSVRYDPSPGNSNTQQLNGI